MNCSRQLLRPHDLDEGRLRDVASRSGRASFKPENRDKQGGANNSAAPAGASAAVLVQRPERRPVAGPK
jgi:hypothetical protein